MSRRRIVAVIDPSRNVMAKSGGDHSPRAAQDYLAQYPDPIDAPAGATLRVDREDAEYPGWWWCTASDGRSGWVPTQLLDPAPAAGARARLRRAYTARELSVRRGERLVIEEEHAGWLFVRNEAGLRGWVPATHVSRDT